MKLRSVIIALLASAWMFLNSAAQSAPNELYLSAYGLIQEAESLSDTGRNQLARERFTEAQEQLKRLQNLHPTYNKNAVEFRLEYVEQKLKTLPAEPGNAQQEVKPAIPDPNDPKALQQRIAQLESNNSMLQAKLQEALAARPAEVDPGQHARSQERINQLEKEKELLRVSLEQAQAKQPQAADKALLDQVRGELEATKKQLRENIATVATLSQENQRLRTAAPAPAGSTSGGDEVARLKARLEVFEAKRVPFTREELALMDRNLPSLAISTNQPVARQTRELPPGAGLLISQAQRAFAARRFDEAEDKYKQVLKMDEENPVSLANLAAIQLELQKRDEAETNLKKALSVQPDDSYALSLMGMLRFQQGRYDDALDALSRSAQLDPKNAETQNYLGITLSQKGLREAAETALRKAIVLNPNYAGAHHNLAVIYATQKPPFIELARFHYNKALALGQPGNPELEKQLRN
jgi:Flp pilus assembly protein TadD